MPETKEKSICHTNHADPSYNVREMIAEATERSDDLRNSEVNRVNERISALDSKMNERDIKYQVQFNAAKEALGIALIAQEKGTAQALDGTKEAINKAEVATDKRFQLLSEKIDAVSDILSKNSGAQGIYVTHTDLNIFGDKMQTSFEDALKPLVSQVNALTAAQNNQTGKEKGAGTSWQTMVTIISVCGTLIAIFFALSK